MLQNLCGSNVRFNLNIPCWLDFTLYFPAFPMCMIRSTENICFQSSVNARCCQKSALKDLVSRSCLASIHTLGITTHIILKIPPARRDRRQVGNTEIARRFKVEYEALQTQEDRDAWITRKIEERRAIAAVRSSLSKRTR